MLSCTGIPCRLFEVVCVDEHSHVPQHTFLFLKRNEYLNSKYGGLGPLFGGNRWKAQALDTLALPCFGASVLCFFRRLFAQYFVSSAHGISRDS